MRQTATLCLPRIAATAIRGEPAAAFRRQPWAIVGLATALTATALALWPLSARGVDGCQVLLCLAAPDWRQIAPCVPPVQQVLRDLRRGRPFPRCDLAGPDNGARDQPTALPDLCPPQYTRLIAADENANPIYVCDFSGVISVDVQGQPWTRVWWATNGDSVTEFLPAAQAQLGSWNTRFEADYNAWKALQP